MLLIINSLTESDESFLGAALCRQRIVSGSCLWIFKCFKIIVLIIVFTFQLIFLVLPTTFKLIIALKSAFTSAVPGIIHHGRRSGNQQVSDQLEFL